MRSPTLTVKVKGWAIAPSNLLCGSGKDGRRCRGRSPTFTGKVKGWAIDHKNVLIYCFKILNGS
ncbi:MAG: hypothetical protein WBA89_06195 [Microcoleus sp.]